jgi:hypothetical protein
MPYLVKFNACKKHANSYTLMPIHQHETTTLMVHVVLNKFVDELLALLCKHLLPLDSCLPLTTYVAKMQTRKACFNYKNKHVCVNGFVLFQKQNRMLKIYPKWVNSLYKESTYNEGQSFFFFQRTHVASNTK